MASNERIRKYLDAGTVLGQVSRGRAEEIVRELVNAGDIQRSQAQEWVDNLVERSRKSSEQVLELVRHEVASQLERIDPKSLEALANQVAEVLKKSAEAGRNATKDVTAQAGKAAKDVTTKAGKTAKGVTTQAGKTAKGVTTQAGKTATRARDAATKVAPSRLPGIKTPPIVLAASRAPRSRTPRRLRGGRLGAQEGRQLTSGARRRLDAELVRRGLVDSRQEAQAAVAAGTRPRLRHAGRQAGAPGRPGRAGRPPRAALAVRRPGRPQARGGTGPLAIDVAGRRALDAGASTGGFTDCLLQRGAAHVYAVDVGHGQLHPALRGDPRVTVLERTNVRTLTPADLRAADPAFEPCPLVVADLSFISLRSVVPALTGPVSAPGRRPGPPGQAPVRGGPGRRLPGQGRGAGPRPVAGRARGRGVRARMTPEPASWERWLPP